MAKETQAEREARWQAEEDFHTLMDYEKLIKDPERLKRAKKLAKEKKNELTNLLNRTKED